MDCILINDQSLVDEITFKKAAEAGDVQTQSAILGPFFRDNPPLRQMGDSITFDTPKDGQVTFMHGRIVSAKTKEPVRNAIIHIWEASTNGT